MTNDLKAAALTGIKEVFKQIGWYGSDNFEEAFSDIIVREIQPVVEAEAERRFVERCQVALEMRKKPERYKKALQEISEKSSTLRQAWETARQALGEGQ